MSILDSKAQYLARAKEIGLSERCVESLHTHGIDSLGSLAFAVGTTPGECSNSDFQQFVVDKQIHLEGPDEFLLKRLIFEAQTLFMTSIQNQVLSAGLSGNADSSAKKLPPIERQARITEQKTRLVGIIIQGESEPSFELIDLAYSMIESKTIKFIPPHRCTKRDTGLLENTNKEKEVLTIEQGRLTSKKSTLPNTSTSDALKLSNCFLRRSLALDLAQVTSFTQINKYHQLLMAQLAVKAPAGYASPSLQQIIQADKFFWSKLAEKVGIEISSRVVDPIIQEIMNSPEFSLYLLPRPEPLTTGPTPKSNPNTAVAYGKNTSDRPRPDRDGPYKGKSTKGKGKGKSKSSSVSMPAVLRGLNPKTREGKPKCFDFNMTHGCSHRDGACPKGDHSCMFWSCADAKHSYQICQAKNKKTTGGGQS